MILIFHNVTFHLFLLLLNKNKANVSQPLKTTQLRYTFAG